jgi:putative Mg2+ transporter-C (MgtC) family protein
LTVSELARLWRQPIKMITWEDILLRLSVAACMGGLVGIERERKDWAAGLRTHMMVCVGAALTMMVSAFGFKDILGTGSVVLDPSRVAAQVISGIGFIGAGTILFLRQEVIRGLTTAAGLWTVAAIGLAAGGGMYFAAWMTTFVVLIILWLLKPLEQRLFRKYRTHLIRIEAEPGAAQSLVAAIQELLSVEKLEFYNLSIEKNAGSSTFLLRFRNIGDTNRILVVTGKLQILEGIRQVSWDRGN